MKTFYLNTRMKKLGLSFLIIPLLFAFPNMVLSQVVAHNPVCYGNPIKLMCNFNDGCSNPAATFSWHNTSSSWISNVRDPVLFPPGSFLIGDGQTMNGSGHCNGEGYATDSIYLTLSFGPPPVSVHSGSVHVMVNSMSINISGTVKDLGLNPLNGGTAYMFNTNYGVLDTAAFVPVNSGIFVFTNTCGADRSPILIIPPTANPPMIPTYLGDTPSWSDATQIIASSSMPVGTIHMIRKPSSVQAGGLSIIQGNVYRVTQDKANDPIDNVGVIVKRTSNNALWGYETSNGNGYFNLGHIEQGNYAVNTDYPGIKMYTQNGANIIQPYNAYDTVNLTIRVVSDSIMTDSNFIRVYPAYMVSPSCSVLDDFVAIGNTTCFDALQNLTVAGKEGYSVDVHSGGTAYFVSGQKIIFKPGFNAAHGSYVWGHITTNGQYCSHLVGPSPSPDGMTITEGKDNCAHAAVLTGGTSYHQPESVITGNKETMTEQAPSFDQDPFFKVYPNPTSGSITLELSVEPVESVVSARCYDDMGSLILEKEYHSGKRHELSLAGHAPGIYLLRVRMNGETGFKKIIKQ